MTNRRAPQTPSLVASGLADRGLAQPQASSAPSAMSLMDQVAALRRFFTPPADAPCRWGCKPGALLSYDGRSVCHCDCRLDASHASCSAYLPVSVGGWVGTYMHVLVL